MLLIRNITVYTMEDEGVLENMDVLCENGRIARIARNIEAEGAQVIEGEGLYLTPGLIDAHSHTGLGIADPLQDANEMTNPVTPELNAIYSVDIRSDEFRQLCNPRISFHCIDFIDLGRF